MLRHSLNRYLELRKEEFLSQRENCAKQKASFKNEWQKWLLFQKKNLSRLDNKLNKIVKALKYLNNSEFHQRLRNFVKVLLL